MQKYGKQQEVSVAGFAPIGEGETVAKTWIQMLANGGKCNSNWKVGTKLLDRIVLMQKKEFPELNHRGGGSKICHLFNGFAEARPAIMAKPERSQGIESYI